MLPNRKRCAVFARVARIPACRYPGGAAARGFVKGSNSTAGQRFVQGRLSLRDPHALPHIPDPITRDQQKTQPSNKKSPGALTPELSLDFLTQMAHYNPIIASSNILVSLRSPK